MAQVFDVARYITEKTGPISSMKLQKLMYYAQAWSLVWDEEPLFADDFEAWANGPVLRRLYARHSGQFKVDAEMFQDGNTNAITDPQKDNINKVLSFYGQKSAHWLSNLTHMEDPWVKARGGAPVGSPSNAVISKAAMAEYYDSL